MDFNELKENAEQICKELKDKAPADLSALALSLSAIIKMMITMVSGLMEQNEKQATTNSNLLGTIKDLQETIKELQRKLNMDSHNSSKPPSSDGYKKAKKDRSLREKTGRKTGGQKGHKGVNMKLPHEPDEVKIHLPEKCKTCPYLSSCTANGHVFECTEKRYVVEAVIKTNVIEHQIVKALDCPCGEVKLKGEFPENVKGYIQYGDSFTAISGLLSTFGAVSTERIQTLIDGMFNVSLSEGTICSMIKKCALKVKPVVQKIRECLIDSDVVNFDETGVRVEGSTQWVHNSSNEKYTYLTVNQKRGKIGIEDNGVITKFKGTAVHDCWGSYWKFDNVSHAVCCVHLLRELISISENNPSHIWANRLKNLLLTMKSAKENAIEQDKSGLNESQIIALEREYDEIMAYANMECPPPDNTEPKKRGKRKKGKERSLIERLIKLKASVCLFIHNFAVPFDNNQAERDIRNVKTKSKVSGCFRSVKGAQNYLTITSFLSTARKQGIDAFVALTSAFNGEAEKIILGVGSE
ncbi:MAG: IS66 family transposase [Succinivibrio sp.]